MPDNPNINNEVSQLYNPPGPGRSEIEILEAIDKKFDWLLRNGTNVSASNANNRYGRNGSDHYQNLRRNRGYGSSSRDFSDEVRRTLQQELFGNSQFRRALNDIRNQVAKDLGVSLEDLPKSLGQAVGKDFAKKIKKSGLFRSFDKYTGDIGKRMKEAYSKGRGNIFGSGEVTEAMNTMSDGIRNASRALNDGAVEELTGSLADTAAASGGAEAALGGLKNIVAELGPEGLALALAIEVVTDIIGKKLKATLVAFNDMMKATSNALGRYEKSREKNIDLAQARLEADIRTMAETPFKILEDAAQRWYDTWDSTLRSISATQGYTKDQVSYLYGSFVDRLKSDGLTSVIGANELVNNLSNVLSKGLQGAAAEEFAYVATKLNAAIPTQDFFNYADTYASVAMQAINQGKTQEEALAIANKELETFADSLLSAGREISGGFTTGLQNASDLFAKAEQIAQTGRLGTGAQLGSALTAISAITGAVAPDLAQSLVDAIYKAAVGGNASELVALRSLAGINASNTQFLQALVQNPQQILADIFDKLYTYQNMANGAYMEVAEGLSGIFGVSMDTLARVDFSQVADAVRQSSESSGALDASMKLLKSGQSTTNAELMRIAQVNEYLADEGLAYVLDNEAARAVMQHMWNEQLAREIMETTYAVELKGTAVKFLEKLAGGVSGILNLVNPLAWGAKVTELVTTAKQDDAIRQDIAQLLTLGQVGAGNAQLYSNLTSYNKKLDLTPDIVSLFGGRSSYAETNQLLSEMRDYYVDIRNFRDSAWNVSGENVYAPDTYRDNTYERSRKSPIKRSAYSWNTVGKSALASMYADYAAQNYGANEATVAATTAVQTAQSQSRLVSNLQTMLDSMEDFYKADTTRTFEDYLATAKTYGIADYSAAVEEAGLTEEAIENKFREMQSQAGAQAKAEREKKEDKFWDESLLNFTKSNEWLESINSTASNIYTIFDKYLSEWEDYYIKHTVYNNAYTRDTVQKVLDSERESSETAIYALADALTQNDVSLLVDPTMQTNALLAQILKVANAILTQGNNGVGGISLPDTLAGLSLGIVNQ
ncbi:hypothetical protein [Ruminococcus sp.]|uniref:hypothetical protein n=1 Tax=Ruminococcus sp. TaxID=41978 RepID=UPI001B77896E|nr:hypothetical protein [Ruminococcus sp.]MBP5433630.1 hypothetical protein [Ruminococcus sp.]